MSKHRLTPLLHEQILASIRAGGYPHVAAEAWGVPREEFEQWLRRGLGRRAKEPFAGFAAAVREAHAQARLRAETEAFAKDPKVWLEHGPGRETPERSGWSASVKAAETAQEPDNVLLRPDVMEVLRSLLKLLEPFPEARAHAAARLVELNKGRAA